MLNTSAVAQQPPVDPVFLQHAVTAVQDQRNRAMDEAAAARARELKLQADLAAVTKERDELKAKCGDRCEPPKPEPPAKK